VKKTVVAPGQGRAPSEDLDGPRSAVAVATHHEDCIRVELTGLATPGETVREQARDVLGLVERVLGEFDGTANDLIKTRWHFVADTFDQEARATIHEVRDEFLDGPHHPRASW